jgi:phosphoribosyl-ATP pyrophosphohydrolase
VYHTLVLMVEKNVNIGEIKGELYKRHKWYNYVNRMRKCPKKMKT